jgi:predicted RecA/RadA family phage recombinase
MSEGRIQPGPVRGQLSARAWNRAQDAADIVLGQRSDGTAAGPSDGPKPYTPILARNSTTGTVNRWGVLSVAGVVFTPSGATGNATQQFQDQPVLSGGLPTGGSSFVVAVEPIAAGKIGRCAVAGVVQAKVNVTDASHGFAKAKDGDLTQLSSADTGDAQILWKESGTGASKWAIVRFGAGAGASIRLGKVTGTWSKGSTVTVTQWKGDGSAAVSGPSGPLTFSAINRAQTVTGPTGGYWVGCESIDGTWHLEWAECS